MNKVENFLLTIIVGEYILDEMNKDKEIEILPKPFKYLRNKYLQYKINNLK